jgi:transcriptional regulator with XRE-family HTH domain
MNSVERVKAICSERKIAISKLEKDLGFGNGYIGQLRKGVFPADRLAKIADYLNVTTDYLLTGAETKKAPAPIVGDELDEVLERLRTRPECRMLFKLADGATPDDVKKAAAIIEALRKVEDK